MTEYDVIDLHEYDGRGYRSASPDRARTELAAAAADGWQLVTVDNGYAYMRRDNASDEE